MMLALLDIVQGVISTIMQAAGFGQPQSAVLPSEIVSAIEDCGFFESIPLWAVTLIGGLFIWVLSFQMILSVYGRFFKMFMYTAIAPIHAVGDHTLSKGKPHEQPQCVFRAFDFRQRTAGFHHTDHKEQYQQRIANSLQGSVNAGHHIPKGAALEAGGGLGNELPDLTELVIPDIQGFFQVLYDPVV